MGVIHLHCDKCGGVYHEDCFVRCETCDKCLCDDCGESFNSFVEEEDLKNEIKMYWNFLTAGYTSYDFEKDWESFIYHLHPSQCCQKPKHFLSIDCGKNNLAFCVVDKEAVIKKWEIISWKDLKDLIRVLDELRKEFEFETCVIEQQQNTNASMYKLMNQLEMYFNIYEIDCVIQSAKLKLKKYQKEFNELLEKCKVRNKGAEYRTRKKTAIQVCKGIIEDTQENWIEFFNSHKKKDDLADCFLQIDYFLKFSK